MIEHKIFKLYHKLKQTTKIFNYIKSLLPILGFSLLINLMTTLLINIIFFNLPNRSTFSQAMDGYLLWYPLSVLICSFIHYCFEFNKRYEKFVPKLQSDVLFYYNPSLERYFKVERIVEHKAYGLLFDQNCNLKYGEYHQNVRELYLDWQPVNKETEKLLKVKSIT